MPRATAITTPSLATRFKAVALLTCCGTGLLLGCPEQPKSPAQPGAITQPAGTSKPNQPAAVQVTPAQSASNPDRDKRLGDAGLTRLAMDHPEHYPLRDTWATVGRTGGIAPPAPANLTVPLGGDIQQAIDKLDTGVVELAAGEHNLEAPLTLKSGITLRGAETGATLRYGQDGNPTAITLTQARDAAVVNLTLLYTGPHTPDPEADPTHYISAPGFTPTDAAAIQFTSTRDCHLDRITIHNPLSHPIALRDATHCTLRDITVTGVRNRGHGSGELILHASDHLLLTALRLRDVRLIRITGPSKYLVFHGMVSGAGVYFDEADLIEGLLFEDCHWFFTPGYPFAPFAKGPMPMGPGSLIINNSVYYRGTDAVHRRVFEQGRPYAINRYATRDNAPTPGGEDRVRFISPYTYQRLFEPTAEQGATVTIAPAFDAAPAGVPVMQIHNSAPMNHWVWTSNFPGGTDDIDITDVVKPPLQPATSRTIGKREVEVTVVGSAPPADDLAGREPANLQQVIGRWGMPGIPPRGGKLELLDQAGGDWEGGLVLQRLVHVPGKPTLTFDARLVGVRGRFFINTTPLTADTPFTPEPGYHLITALLSFERKTTMITSASLAAKFNLIPEPGPMIRTTPVPKPAVGRIYPYHPGIDPLDGERTAIQDWPTYFNKTLRTVPAPDRLKATQAMIDQHPGSHVAWVLDTVKLILAEAPYDEDAQLTALQWGELSDYYRRRGLFERHWAIDKAMKPAKYRAYYPDKAKEAAR